MGRNAEKPTTTATDISKQAEKNPRPNLVRPKPWGGKILTAQNSAAASSSSLLEDIDDIKEQLKYLTGFLAKIAPVITETKSAYDDYIGLLIAKAMITMELSLNLNRRASKGKAREEFNMLTGMAKVVKKPQQWR